MPSQPVDDSSQAPQRHYPTHYYFEPGGRPFRSRKNRPCDCCRRTKTRCTIGSEGPPCFECIQTKKNCTFEEGPPVRKNRLVLSERPGDSPVGGSLHALANAAASLPAPSGSRRKDYNNHDTTGLMSSGSPDAVGGSIHPSPHSVASLDTAASESYEPHVLTAILTDDLLPISGSNVPGAPHAKQISTNSQKPVYVVFAPRPDVRTAHDPGVQVLYRVRSLLRALPSSVKEDELLRLYLTNVHPAFPILPLLKNMGEFPPYLLSAIYATALNHRKDLREMSAAAWTFVHAPNVADPGLDSPRLSTVAAAVLDIGARPTLDPRGNYLTLAKTIAHAQLLGLHLNPTKWSIPSWEKDLRIRLWWGLKIHDAWMSFLNSRPSHMQIHNTDIPLPSLASITSAVDNQNSAICGDAFWSLCRLAELVGRLQDEICTIKSQEKAKQVKLKELAVIENETRELERKWESHVARHGDLQTGVQSLILHILCFRCMLRRIYIETEAGIGGPFRSDQDTINMFMRAVVYISKLTDDDLEAFWLCYSSHIISSLLSSLIRICLASLNTEGGDASIDAEMSPQTGPDDSHAVSLRNTAPLVDNGYAHAITLHLLSTLTAFLKNARDQGRWDVADPALVRASSVISRLRTWEEGAENSNMILALEGHPFPFPHPPQWQHDGSVPQAQQPTAQQQSIHPSQVPPPPPPPQVVPSMMTPEMAMPVGINHGPYPFVPGPVPPQHTPSPVRMSSYQSGPPSATADHQRSPTPPQHVAQMYTDAYGNGIPVAGPHTAAQSPSEAGEIHGPQGLAGPELDMLGMDGVTFWTPWMSNIGLDGNGNVDESLHKYNYMRPAGW